MRAGFVIVGATFSVVALVLLGQLASAVVRLPGLYYVLALCDVPATLGAWVAALGAFDARSGVIGRATRSHLLVAAVALTAVAGVVYLDLGTARLAPVSTVAGLLQSKLVWACVGGASAIALGALSVGAERAVVAAGAAPNKGLHQVIVGLIVVRAFSAILSTSVPVPFLLRLGEAPLYAAVAAALFLASKHCRPAPGVLP